MKRSLAEQLKAARERLGEGQVEFAKRFPIHQSLLNRWETGKRKPTQIAAALIRRVLLELKSPTHKS